jgi:hypothetical protein
MHAHEHRWFIDVNAAASPVSIERFLRIHAPA